MEYFLVSIVALVASILTFFSGFGLGTILLPTFLLFFPAEVAIGLTAIVHFLNNIFKTFLVGKSINFKVLLTFGGFALVGAFLGAKLLNQLSHLNNQTHFFLGFETTLLNLVVGGLLIFFSLFELVPKLKNWNLSAKYLMPGGFLSGFFGGLSGHQGALRSAFLVKAGLEKQAFIATGVAIALVVDAVRISVYINDFDALISQENATLLVYAIISAFIGVFLGKRILKKITIGVIQGFIGVLMILMGSLLILGILGA